MKLQALLISLLFIVSSGMSFTPIVQPISESSHEPLWQVGDFWTFQNYQFNDTQYYLYGTVEYYTEDIIYNVSETTTFQGIESFKVTSDQGVGFAINYYYSVSDFALLGVDFILEFSDQRFETNLSYRANDLPYLNFSDFGEGNHLINAEFNGISTVTNTTNPLQNTTNYMQQSQSQIFAISSEIITINGYTFDTYRIETMNLQSSSNTTSYENGVLSEKSIEEKQWFANNTGYIESLEFQNFMDNSSQSTISTVHYNDTQRGSTSWVSKRFGHTVMTSSPTEFIDTSTITSTKIINGTYYYTYEDEIAYIYGPNSGISNFDNFYYSLYGDADAPPHSSSTISTTSSTNTTTTDNSTTSTSTTNTTQSSTMSTNTTTNTTTQTTTTTTTTTTSDTINTTTTSSETTTPSSTTDSISDSTRSNTSTSPSSSTTQSTSIDSTSAPDDTTVNNDTSSSTGPNFTDVTLPVSAIAVLTSFMVIEILRYKKRSP